MRDFLRERRKVAVRRGYWRFRLKKKKSDWLALKLVVKHWLAGLNAPFLLFFSASQRFLLVVATALNG